jgi:hypothetical protein
MSDSPPAPALNSLARHQSTELPELTTFTPQWLLSKVSDGPPPWPPLGAGVLAALIDRLYRPVTRVRRTAGRGNRRRLALPLCPT